MRKNKIKKALILELQVKMVRIFPNFIKKNYVVHGVKRKAQASIQIELITFFIKIDLNYIMEMLQIH